MKPQLKLSKEAYLEVAKKHVLDVRDHILRSMDSLNKLIHAKIGSAKVEDRWTNAAVKAMNQYRYGQMEILKDSPYFNKCDVDFNGGVKTYYIGKFSFPEEQIYSWVAPIASIRFDNPGHVSYTLPSGEIRTSIMSEKDHYQIIDGRIVFYSKESIDSPRELIYQENFTHKQGFLLPEIVSVMEKAQDTIIRAHHKGPFLISGPAGSGKTTLALHRIAYLFQAPHTAEIYKDQSIVVFVQDQRSKDYFSHLLPELGIKSVQIMTFTEWALDIIDIEDIQAVASYSHDLYYEYQKIQALRKIAQHNGDSKLPLFSEKPFFILDKIYSKEFSKENKVIFDNQKKNKVLDRIDVTILLMAYLAKFKKLSTTRNVHQFDTVGVMTTKKKRFPLEYALIMIDEFQNYLPEQIHLFNTVINQENQSVIYVGDGMQQINPGTMGNLMSNQSVELDRNIKLQKVYRNTKKIIQYIQRLGYSIDVPESIKEGTDVVENDFDDKFTLTTHLDNLIKNRAPNESIAILAVDKESLDYLYPQIETSDFVHILTIRESQGLEFDTVCIIDFDKETYFENYKNSPTDFQEEKRKIDKDLLYIALTRAISRLEILNIVK